MGVSRIPNLFPCACPLLLKPLYPFLHLGNLFCIDNRPAKQELPQLLGNCNSFLIGFFVAFQQHTKMQHTNGAGQICTNGKTIDGRVQVLFLLVNKPQITGYVCANYPLWTAGLSGCVLRYLICPGFYTAWPERGNRCGYPCPSQGDSLCCYKSG